MSIFLLVFFKTISVLLNVIIGFLAGKYSNVERDSIVSLLFYFIAPIVFFSIPASTSLTLSDVSITFVTFACSSLLCVTAYHIFGFYWQDHTRGVLALSAGTANCGYFMLPIATALFDDYTLSIYMMAVIGINIYESSVGFYTCAKNLRSTKESFIKVLKLPTLNSFWVGCAFSVSGFTLPDFLDDFIFNMRGAYSILGMITVGLGLSTIKNFEIDIKFTFAAFFSKFFAYPLLINIIILFDRFISHCYNKSYYNALQLISTAPMAANIIIIANLQKLPVERIATTILLSLGFVIIYMPIMISIFLSDVN